MKNPIDKKEAYPEKLTKIYNKNKNWNEVLDVYLKINTDCIKSDIILFPNPEFISNNKNSLSKHDIKFLENINKSMQKSDVFIQCTIINKVKNSINIDGSTKTKIIKTYRLCLIQCGNKKCNQLYVLNYDATVYKGNCYECRMKLKSIGQFKNVVEYVNITEKYNCHIDNLMDYIDDNTQFILKCPNGKSQSVKAIDILKFKNIGIKCVECNTIHKESVVEETREEKIKRIIKEKNCTFEAKIKESFIILCNQNLHILSVTPKTEVIDDNVVNCYGCQVRTNLKNTKQQTNSVEIQKEFEEYNIILLSEYVNTQTILKLQCLNCNQILYIQYGNWQKNKTCTNCYAIYKKEVISVEEKKILGLQFKKDLESNLYKMIDNYEIYESSSTTKFTVECPHKHQYQTTQSNFVHHKRRCPICNQSKGEELIKKYLDSKNIKHIREFTFPDGQCKNIKNLPFDYYVLHNNKAYMIEFDHIQHFQPVKYFGGEKDYVKRFNNDCKKSYYCTEIANIPLLRISYKEIDIIPELIEDLLKGELTGMIYSNNDCFKKLQLALQDTEQMKKLLKK